jgi:Zn-dependent peptidase ImmA (M78 family)
VTGEMLREIDSRAHRLGVSRSVFLTRLLQWGFEAEKQKREQLAQKVRKLRETTDPSEAERLSNELGEMIFGSSALCDSVTAPLQSRLSNPHCFRAATVRKR